MVDTMVLDASMGSGGGMYCFCPVELDDDNNIASIITGMNFLSDDLPEHGKVIAVVHSEGQGAVDLFCADNPEIIQKIENQSA